MAPIAKAVRLIYRVMSANRQVEKGSLVYANLLLKALYVLVTDMIDCAFRDLSV